MAIDHEDYLERKLKLVVGLVWAMTVGGFSIGGWATTVELRLRRNDDLERTVHKIDYYVSKIANKVGVEIEPPR